MGLPDIQPDGRAEGKEMGKEYGRSEEGLLGVFPGQESGWRRKFEG